MHCTSHWQQSHDREDPDESGVPVALLPVIGWIGSLKGIMYSGMGGATGGMIGAIYLFSAPAPVRLVRKDAAGGEYS